MHSKKNALRTLGNSLVSLNETRESMRLTAWRKIAGLFSISKWKRVSSNGRRKVAELAEKSGASFTGSPGN